jgi:hypothetical protein
MANITTREYPITPTMRWTDPEGRLTGEAFRLMKAVAELVEAVTIEDGEVTTEMLEAEIIRVSTLFADEVIITGKIAQNAISEVTAILQAGSVGPNGQTVLSGVVPVTTTNNTGLLLTFTGFMDLPSPNPANFGYWQLNLLRNGVIMGSTPQLYYDDNFSYQPVASFIDETPGINPVYTVETSLNSGIGAFLVENSVLNVGLLKR